MQMRNIPFMMDIILYFQICPLQIQNPHLTFYVLDHNVWEIWLKYKGIRLFTESL